MKRPFQFVVIHDSEGTLQDESEDFSRNPTSQVGIHYLIDSDGTVYQLIHDQDITYHAANFCTMIIRRYRTCRFDATGYTWYNAAQYLGSAKLMAYLLDKINIPLIMIISVSHGTVLLPT